MQKIKGSIKKRPRNIGLLLAILVLLVVLIGIALLSHHKRSTLSKLPTDQHFNSATDVKIYRLKNSHDVSTMQTLKNLYLGKGDYALAVSEAQQIASKTKSTEDYLDLFTICATNPVPDKKGCIDKALSNLDPVKNSLKFRDAYSVGYSLEHNDRKSEAVAYYQRAYDAYDPAQADEYTMPKDKLLEHINALHQ